MIEVLIWLLTVHFDEASKLNIHYRLWGKHLSYGGDIIRPRNACRIRIFSFSVAVVIPISTLWKVSLLSVNFSWGSDAKEQTNYSTLGLTCLELIILSCWTKTPVLYTHSDNSLLTTIMNVRMVYMNGRIGFRVDDLVLWYRFGDVRTFITTIVFSML